MKFYGKKKKTLINYLFVNFRIRCLKKKVYPCRNYPFIMNLNLTDLPLAQLKVLLHLSRITEVVTKRKKSDLQKNMEQPSVYERIIQIKLAMCRISFLLNLHQNGKELTTFQYNSLELAVYYLRASVNNGVLERYGLGKNMLEEMYQLLCLAGNLEYPPMARCFWCNDDILLHKKHSRLQKEIKIDTTSLMAYF